MPENDLPPIKAMMQPMFFGDTAKGGYIHSRRCDELGFTETVSAKTRRGPVTLTLEMDGDDRQFHTIAEFKAAYYERYPERLQAALEARDEAPL